MARGPDAPGQAPRRRAALRRNDPDVGNVRQVGVGVGIGGIGEPPSIGRPGGVGVVALVLRDLTRLPSVRGKRQHLLPLPIPKALAVVLVPEARDHAHVALGGPGRGPGWFANHGEPPAVGGPGHLGWGQRARCDLARFPAVCGDDPDLFVSAPIRDEGEAGPVRRPPGPGVLAASGGELRRGSVIDGDDPQVGLIGVGRRVRDRHDARHPRSIGGELRIVRDLEREHVFDCDRPRHAGVSFLRRAKRPLRDPRGQRPTARRSANGVGRPRAAIFSCVAATAYSRRRSVTVRAVVSSTR